MSDGASFISPWSGLHTAPYVYLQHYLFGNLASPAAVPDAQIIYSN